MRRALLLIAAVCALAAPAAGQERVWRLGYLSTSADYSLAVREGTLAVLAENGFVEGRNLIVIARFAAADPMRLPALARELAEARVDVVMAVSNAAIRAAREAMPRTPIVMSFAGDDPVRAGFIATLARPGGTVTGIIMRAGENELKRLQLLREVLPAARRFGLLVAPTTVPERVEEMQRAATAMQLDLDVARAGGPDEYGPAIAGLRAAGAEGLIVVSQPRFSGDAPIIARLAIEHGIPTACEWRSMAEAGCMLGFGPDIVELRRRTGDYIARILKGADPGDLPVEQPSRFELIANLRTARLLGVELPAAILLRADGVIE
jgi:putative ABC transport system substrate-binding protein